MIHLPAGTQKFLLLNRNEIERNSQRGKAGSPVAVVVERVVDGDKVQFKRHVGYQVLTNSPVTLAYAQRGVVCPNHDIDNRVDERAAYTTFGEVVITTEPDEAAVMPEAPEKAEPTKGTGAKPVTAKKAKSSNG